MRFARLAGINSRFHLVPGMRLFRRWGVRHVEVQMRKKRTLETAEERGERFKRVALRASDDAEAADNAVDAMVKRSIKLYGA